MEDFSKPLFNSLKEYIKDQETISSINKAYLFALEKHEGQFRKSGEPYITHPVAVATTLADHKADPTTIIAALLHDTIEDTDTSYSVIKEQFGDEVANLVMGLTKIEKVQYSDEERIAQGTEAEYASNFQKMLFQMSKDIRVIWIKLADRLNNMKTLEFMPFEKQVRISNETQAIYAPMAHKLGMYQIKAELEDLSFKYLYPEDYIEISKKLKSTKKSREADIDKMTNDLSELLIENGIQGEISGRVKNFYSIYKKMKKKGLPFENIYDLQALRVIVDSVMDCYKAIGIIHSKYSPMPARFKDYVAMPKPNMYQSLHTTVINQGRIYEIQVRTHEMDEIAENGIAAHWVYKEGVSFKANYYEQTANELRWYKDLLKLTSSENSKEDRDNATNLFQEEVFDASVYVFTPKNTVVALPEGSTPLDFAYRIHTRIGEQFIGAIVNGKIVPIDYQFKTGDVCEIKTSSNAYGPNENWLNIAKTNSAKNKIKQYLNRKNRDVMVEQGKVNIQEEIKAQNLNIDLTDELVLKKCDPGKQFKSLEDLYYACGKGTYSAKSILYDFTEEEFQNSNEKIIDLINKRNKNQVYHEDIEIVVEGLNTPSVKLAHCCSPIPGDDIIGYITKGVGIAVHRKCCKNIQGFDQNRMIPVYWSSKNEKRFRVDLRLFVYNRDNILSDILNTAISYNSKVVKVSAKSNEVNQAYISLTVQVLNKIDLETMISNLEKIKGIYSIERVSH